MAPSPPVPTPVVFVTGGVCSSLGKGIVAASLSRAFRNRNLHVAAVKFDPYLNADPGTMNPAEHGEVYVTADGAEADLDLGAYARLGGATVTAASTLAAGRVYGDVLAAERRGDYLGRTVQVVPHIVDRICAGIDAAADPAGGARPDLVIVELGGTIGDLEVGAFCEAFRRYRIRPGQKTALVHLALVPEVGPNRELKTKPAQHSCATLRSYGLTADLVLLRAYADVGASVCAKVARVVGLPAERVVAVPDSTSIYQVPGELDAAGVPDAVLDLLGIDAAVDPAAAGRWNQAAGRLTDRFDTTVRVGLCGKYADGADTYLSVIEAVNHAAAARRCHAEVVFVDTSAVDPAALDRLDVDAVIIPGGFGTRGVEGKIDVVAWARRTGTPLLGICLGLQVICVERARSVGLDAACSAEWDRPGPQIVTLMNSQRQVTELGGTMRLGAYPAVLTPGTRTDRLYRSANVGAASAAGWVVSERHRHRFEVNPAHHGMLEQAGLALSGMSPDGTLVEFVEDTDHPYLVATQAHPEFESYPTDPNPLFTGLIDAALR